jgi:hypothetical protein
VGGSGWYVRLRDESRHGHKAKRTTRNARWPPYSRLTASNAETSRRPLAGFTRPGTGCRRATPGRIPGVSVFDPAGGLLSPLPNPGTRVLWPRSRLYSARCAGLGRSACQADTAAPAWLWHGSPGLARHRGHRC